MTVTGTVKRGKNKGMYCHIMDSVRCTTVQCVNSTLYNTVHCAHVQISRFKYKPTDAGTDLNM